MNAAGMCRTTGSLFAHCFISNRMAFYGLCIAHGIALVKPGCWWHTKEYGGVQKAFEPKMHVANAGCRISTANPWFANALRGKLGTEKHMGGLCSMTMGEKIQQLRRAAGLSQEQLATQLGVSHQSVSKWERDEVVPDVSKVVLLSELFGVTTDALLKGGEASAAGCEAEDAAPREAQLLQVAHANFAHREILAGFLTAMVGLVLLALEFMFLPTFGAMQKAQVNGQGFYTDFMRYAQMQPMPTIFTITGLVVAAGTLLLLKGLWDKHGGTRLKKQNAE